MENKMENEMATPVIWEFFPTSDKRRVGSMLLPACNRKLQNAVK